jgi:hypothetical protein
MDGAKGARPTHRLHVAEQEDVMTEFQCDSYCGLYCGACDMLLASRRAEERGIAPSWDGVHFPLKGQFATASVVCHGCKSDIVFRGCSVCPVRKCARSMPGIETCVDCRRYPCFRHWLVTLVRRLAGLERRLPHLSVLPGNVAFIRDSGVKAWLEEQQRRWTCPSCHTAFSWYQRECAGCDRDVEELKSFRTVPLPPSQR